MKFFRFIDSGSLDGAANMAVDETLARTLAQHRDHGYVRFYRWMPPTLSFGYNQHIEKLIDLDMAAQRGFDIVRRMSGGKMVFHNNELTFSVGLTAEFINMRLDRAATFLEMFKFAVEPIIEALVKHGVPARFSSSREIMKTSENHLHCYAAAAGHSIFAGQHKLIGAAGIFRDNCMVAHGSIPISSSFPPDELFLGVINPQANIEIASLQDFIENSAINNLPGAIAEAYGQKFNLPLKKEALTEHEVFIANDLAKEKYGNLNWHKQKTP